MTTMTLSPVLRQRFVDNNGNALYLGQLASFAAGTSTPLVTYQDSVGTVNANPVILNPRGEANVWIPPNVAYKFTLSDASGNLIWTIDNVVNSQLITLYGGVDGGVVNAYTLSFAAPFTAYADGIVIYWVPSNTNTGASTINVNGLGVVSIINQNGSALTAGQLIANQIAVVMYKGTGFQLISSGLASSSSATLFAARRSTGAGNQTLTNNATTTVIFDTADVNQGSNYAAGTGIYTAPVAGIYTFQAELAVQSNATTGGQLYGPYYFSKNNSFAVPNIIALAGLFQQEVIGAGGTTANSLGFFSGSATFQLNAGDTVRVRCQQPNNSGGAFQIFANTGHNNFSGYKCG